MLIHTNLKLVHVAVAVIINDQDQILITKRSADQHQGNKWEFPGGKIEEGEATQQALHRELKEELGIEISSACHVTDITHQYSDKKVFIEVFEVRNWSGEPTGQQGQPHRWIEKDELKNYEFPKANAEIIRIFT